MADIFGSNDMKQFAEFDAQLKMISASLEKAVESLTSVSDTMNKNTVKSLLKLKEEIMNSSGSAEEMSRNLRKLEDKLEALSKKKAKVRTDQKAFQEQMKKSAQEVDHLRKKLDQLKNAKDGGSISSGKFSKGLASIGGAILGVSSGVGLLINGVMRIQEEFMAAFNSAVEFESSMKAVGAITRSSDAELIALAANANKLGASTEYTSLQIAELQKELGKLGFNSVEIINTTEAVVDLATATGESLAGAGTVAAATLRAFNLSAVDSKRVVDVMAGSFVRSGLDLEKFRESMKLLAPIAEAANIDLETTTAMLSRLADAGLSGSLAGTSLRNVISNLADPNSKLSKYLGQTVNNSTELIEVFKRLNKEGIGLAEVVELVDVRARPAFLTMVSQIDTVASLSKEYSLLNGESQRLAESMRDTLKNDLEITSSAFDALGREFMTNVTPAIRSSTNALTGFIEAMRFWMKDGLNTNEVIGVMGDKFARFVGLSAAMGKNELKLIDLTQKEGIEQLEQTLQGVADIQKKINPEYMKMVDEARKFNRAKEEGKELTEQEKKRLEEIAVVMKEQFGTHTAFLDGEKDRVIMTELIAKNVEQAEQKLLTSLEALAKQKDELKMQIANQEEKLKTFKAEGNWLDKLGWKRGLTNYGLKAQNVILTTMQTKYDMLEQTLGKYNQLWDEIQKKKKKADDTTDDLLANTKSWLEVEKQRAQFAVEDYQQTMSKAGKSTDEQIGLARKLAEEKKRLADITYKLEIKAIEAATKSENDKNIERTLAYEKMVNEKMKADRDYTNFVGVENQKRFEKEQEVLNKLFDMRMRSLKMDGVLLGRETSAIMQNWLLQNDRAIFETEISMRGLHDFQIKETQEKLEKLRSLNLDSLKIEREQALEQNQTLMIAEKRRYEQSEEYRKDTDETRIERLKQIEAIYKKTGENITQDFDNRVAQTNDNFNVAIQESAQKTAAIVEESLKSFDLFAQELFSRASERRAEELRKIDQWEQERIQLAGDNEQAITIIEREAERRRREMMLKEARAKKAQTVYNILMSTAQAVANALSVGFPPANIITAKIIGAQGLAQALFAATRPLPQYAEGTDNSTDGPAVVSEEGRELVIEKSGKAWLTPDKPSVVDLKGGSKVIPHDETESILSGFDRDTNAAILQNIALREERKNLKQASKDTDRLIQAVRESVANIPQTEIHLTESGIERFVNKRGSRIKILNARYGYKK